MAVIEQIGTTALIGIGSNTYDATNVIVETADIEDIADITEIRDEDNAVCTKLISNRGKRISLSCVALASADLTIRKGETITIDSMNMMVEDFKLQRVRENAKISVVGILEDNMTYSV